MVPPRGWEQWGCKLCFPHVVGHTVFDCAVMLGQCQAGSFSVLTHANLASRSSAQQPGMGWPGRQGGERFCVGGSGASPSGQVVMVTLCENYPSLKL